MNESSEPPQNPSDEQTPDTPESLDQLRDAVQASPQVLAVGQQTKPPLSETEATIICTRRLSGITQYEPSEFTFTALAGTPLTEITATLAQRGQYLPFDPVLAGAGSTLGGAVGAGLSGSGRFRYGGIRDFLLGVKFISGEGDWIESGGKVVKNAAGFDIPKLLVGSLGRYGVMAELTFKVFPQPVAQLSLGIKCGTHEQARQRMARVARSRWEVFAIDYQPASRTVHLKLGGPPQANHQIAQEIMAEWSGEVIEISQEESIWAKVSELNFGSHSTVLKVPTSGLKMQQLCEALESADGVALHASLAGQLVWIAVSGEPSLRSIETLLQSLGLSSLVVRGSGRCWLGSENGSAMAIGSKMQRAIKQAMDPAAKFPELPFPELIASL
ncbi:MAG: FAD-binding protein [Rubripirellula sp.]|nr:FAD-binding protein [Rubripirellula sp.]